MSISTPVWIQEGGLRLRRAFGRRSTLRLVVEIVLATLLVIQTARLIWLFVEPAHAATDGAPARPPTTAPDLSIFQRFDAFHRSGATATPGGETGGGGLTLFGVRTGGADSGSAILGLSDGRQVSVGVGEEVEPGVVLQSVGPDSVTLLRNGVAEILAFASAPVAAPAAAGAEPPPPPPVVTPAGDAALSVDPARLMAQASLRPRLRGLSVNGVVVSGRGDGAALRAAGLRSGDVILAVNDTELNSPAAIAGLSGALASAPDARVRVERNGQVQTLTLKVAP